MDAGPGVRPQLSSKKDEVEGPSDVKMLHSFLSSQRKCYGCCGWLKTRLSSKREGVQTEVT